MVYGTGFVASSPCSSPNRRSRSAKGLVCANARISSGQHENVVPRVPSSKLPAVLGGGALSTVANFLISVPAVFRLLRLGARNSIISGAEKQGVTWRTNSEAVQKYFPEEKRVAALKEVTNPDVVYPDYYVKPFHAYDEGNLAWKPAFEVESATKAMAPRAYKKENVTPDVAEVRLRNAHMDAVRDTAPRGWGLGEDFTAVDVGCSCGVSTMWVTRRLREMRVSCEKLATVIGLDASPYFLTVARQQAKNGIDERGNEEVSFIHALAEDTGFQDASVDWWGMQFVVHEMPGYAAREILMEAFRVLKSGGVVSFIDNDPYCETLQKMPPVLATFMKSTEPHSDDYYSTDFVQLLQELGFVDVAVIASDPRHRTIVGVRP